MKHEDTWIVEGDPMEGALLAFAGKSGLDTSEQRRQWTRTDLIPFEARHRFMATLNHDHSASRWASSPPRTAPCGVRHGRGTNRC